MIWDLNNFIAFLRTNSKWNIRGMTPQTEGTHITLLWKLKTFLKVRSYQGFIFLTSVEGWQ